MTEASPPAAVMNQGGQPSGRPDARPRSTGHAPAGLATAAGHWPSRPAPAPANGHLTSSPMATVGESGGHPGLRWILDRDDDRDCVQTLLALSDPASGVLVVLAVPGAPWPVLAREVLLALGKERVALAGLGRRRLVDLATLWLRAERITHLVVLRAHRLPPESLHALGNLAQAQHLVCWPVHHGPTAVPARSLSWQLAVEMFRDSRHGDQERLEPSEVYRRARDLARRAGRTWVAYHQRTMKRAHTVREGSELAELLQPLTIDARDLRDLQLRVHATVTGLRDEGLQLTMRSLDLRRWNSLGPRFDEATISALRRVVCPTGAAALVLAHATDLDAPNLTRCLLRWTDPDGRHLRTTAGTFRVPPQARPFLRALLERHATQVDRDVDVALPIDERGTPMYGRRVAHAVTAAAKTAGLSPVHAGWAREKCYLPEPFAVHFTYSCGLPRSCATDT